MVEMVYAYTVSEEKVIEQLVKDDVAMINHVILKKGDALPEHHSDSNVYLIIVRGAITARFNEQEAHTYEKQILNVPSQTLMNISNEGDSDLEFFIVKAPHPRVYNQKDS